MRYIFVGSARPRLGKIKNILSYQAQKSQCQAAQCPCKFSQNTRLITKYAFNCYLSHHTLGQWDLCSIREMNLNGQFLFTVIKKRNEKTSIYN